jgi:phenylpyruvate tautomerase PptA (4-oxalocrotonate tautomerase family)
MPLLRIQTGQQLEKAAAGQLLREASRLVAHSLGKPERVVMVTLEDGTSMLFAGDSGPAAFMELRAIGLPEDAPSDLSARLCGLAEDALGVPAERVFVNFIDVPRTHWGWNAKTF